MQDYNYVWANCLEITLELSCCKYPYRHELQRFWMENKKALLVYLGQVHRGVRGLIMDTNGNLVGRASMKIQSRDVSFKSSSRGEYWRIMLPGVFTVEVTADGYQPVEKTFTVSEGQITNLNIQLVPIGTVSITNLVDNDDHDNVHEYDDVAAATESLPRMSLKTTPKTRSVTITSRETPSRETQSKSQTNQERESYENGRSSQSYYAWPLFSSNTAPCARIAMYNCLTLFVLIVFVHALTHCCHAW